MIALPDQLSSLYRPAFGFEILSWSFGEVRHLRPKFGSEWSYRRNTLDDEAIFGPKEDYHCMCGFLDNFERTSPYCDLLICPTCGVKYTTEHARRERFGHIELYSVLHHPFGKEDVILDVIPVLPAVYWESDACSHLADRYENVLLSVEAKDRIRIQTNFEDILVFLLPRLAAARKAGCPDAVRIAKGMALMPRESKRESRGGQEPFSGE